MKLITFTKKILLIATLVLAIGCKADRDDEGSDDDKNGNLDLEISSSTNSSGEASIKFTVSAVSPSNKTIRLSRLSVAGKDYLNPNGDSVSLAEDFAPALVTIAVPSRQTDTALTSPQEVSISAQIQNPSSNTNTTDQVLFKVTSRKDGNLSGGSLSMNVFYVGSIGMDPTTKSSTQVALGIARDIFSSKAGINLKIKEIDISGPVILPLPTEGNRIYGSASQDADSPAVNVFIGGDIESIGAGGEVLGISASIPGPPSPTTKSAVAVSLFTSAGSDGIFDSEDLRIFGETIAHESGHFMGLFHPVDFNGSTVGASDPLSDTESCSFSTQCTAIPNLISNLMFPNPVPDGRGSFVPQGNLTNEQRGVLNRYAAVE
jgi:hypothetical protein